jgi:hypothetical protein
LLGDNILVAALGRRFGLAVSLLRSPVSLGERG